MPHATTESDAVTTSLRTLADREGHVAIAPYDFSEFQRRAAARPPSKASQGAVRVLRFAAMIAPIALLLTIAGVQRQSVFTDDADVTLTADGDADSNEPAFVRVGPTARVNDLEDRIAWIDTMISEAPATGLTAEDRASLSSGREALAHSLQRVRYAQTLLDY